MTNLLSRMTTSRELHAASTRRRQARLLPVAGLLLTVALSACGGLDGSSGDDSAAASGDGGGGGSDVSEDDPTLAFYQCLRDNGLDVPDPENPGAMVLPDVDQDDPEQMAIVNDCAAEHLATGDGGAVTRNEGEVDPDAMIEFAECMRDNGVEDFPDPGPGGGLNMTAVDPDTPEFQTAMEECGELLGGSGPVVQR